MSNVSPAVATSAASAGGGIAFLRKQFELRVSAASTTVYEAPSKAPIKKRPVSFRDPQTVFPKPKPDDHSHRSEPDRPPKPREASSLSELTSSPCHAESTPSTSSSFSFSLASLSSSKTIVDAAAGSSHATPKDASDRHLEGIQEIHDEGTSSDSVGQPQNIDLSTPSELHPSDANTSKDYHESTAALTEAEMNDKIKTEDSSSTTKGSKEMISHTSCLNSNDCEFSIVATTDCKTPELESINSGVFKTATKETDAKRLKQAECDADRMLLEETISTQKGPSTKTSSASPRTKWMPVTRSLEDLCSTSAGTPTEELKTICEKKPKPINVPLAAKAAEDVASSQSLDRSASLANKAKPPIRAKKPPPPVPKKTVKFTVAQKSSPAVNDEVKEESNTSINLPSEQDSSSIPTEATPGSEGGEQSQPSLLRRVAVVGAAPTKILRPNSLFPPMEAMSVRNAVESNHDRYKSLPTLAYLQANGGSSPLYNRKDTLFPCNRQKPRPMVGPQQTNQLGSVLTPDFCQRRSMGDSQLLLASPMSLGNRTPPGIDSVITNAEEERVLADCHRPKSVSLHCPLPAPFDTDMPHASTTTRPDPALPYPCPDGVAIDAASAAEQQVPDVNKFSEVSDEDSFLENAFEFLSHEAQPIDNGTKTSPLKSWTDTWYKTSTKNQTEVPARASTTGSELNASRKGNDKSTKGDSNDQDRDMDRDRAEAKSKSQTGAKTEEDRQRTIDESQGLKRKGSFAPVGDRKSPPGDEKADGVIERPKIFGVVLRPKSTCSVPRRSSFMTANTDTSVTSASSSSSAAASDSNRRSSVNLRTSSSTVARPLSRLPSLPSLTFLPSNRPSTKAPGKYVGGVPSVLLEGTSSVQEDNKTDLETDLDAIDKAFDFLDNSGA